MLAAAGLALSAVQLGAGLIQQANASDPKQVEETPEMRQARLRAAEMAKTGFTPAEKAAFKQSLAASGNTAFRRGTDLGGGNLASALRASINSQQLGAQNQFAAQDAALNRQNIANSNQLEQGYQGLKNTQVAQHNQVAQQQNQAAGQSINSGLTGMANVLNLNQALSYNATPTAPNTSINYGANNNPSAFGYNTLSGQYNLGNPGQPTYMYPYQGAQNPPTPTYIYPYQQ